MPLQATEKITESPSFKKLVRRRNQVAWLGTALISGLYFGFISLVAFNKDWLSQPIAHGFITTRGIPFGLGILVFTVFLTGVYVIISNKYFDRLIEKVKADGGHQ